MNSFENFQLTFQVVMSPVLRYKAGYGKNTRAAVRQLQSKN